MLLEERRTMAKTETALPQWLTEWLRSKTMEVVYRVLFKTSWKTDLIKTASN